MKYARTFVSLVVAFASGIAPAEVKLASVFTDHMVLQRDKKIIVWGTADPDKKVTVKLGDDSASDKTDASGKWMVKLSKQKATDAPAELIASEDGGNSVTLHDILIGDVWICSGQSNMGFQLHQAANAAEAIPAATDSKLRLLVVPQAISTEPMLEQKGKWVVCNPEDARTFSAVGYFFGKELREKENLPIGLVGTYWGGTEAECWTPRKYLAGAQWQPLFDRDQKNLEAFPKAHEQWEKKVAAIKDPNAKKPPEPLGPKSPHHPTVLWNAMVQPLIPMSITGVIWYQGESNALRAQQYQTLFPTMISAWRGEFDQGKFPFLFVQLANFNAKSDTDAGSPWAELREAQSMALKLPKTGMAVTIDIGNPVNIHPTDKLTVGKRLALAAEKIAYGKDVEDSGPVYHKMKLEGTRIDIIFDHVDDGLVVKGNEIHGFTIAGEDKKFVPAKAEIQGKGVEVWADSVSDPVAVRYGWADNPTVNLYNKSSLPAVPFRTDDWPEVTAGKQ